MSECDDEVVREIDVYMSDMTQLHLLQFPLRPVYAAPPNAKSARFKPKHRKLELNVPYNPAIFAADMPPTGTSQTLCSSRLDHNTFLAAGVMRDGAIHITPVQEVLQLRPSFDGLAYPTEIIEAMSDEENGEAGHADSKQPLQQVHMRRKENERSEASRLNSYTYAKTKEENEPWVDLSVHTIDSEETEQKFESMFYQTEDDVMEVS
mmetsp:Transcript_333/g.617  ORF Transcript_333/g.617 Transcript_333/m.617 type:complete len:207 (+) Transcript_333:47-667(+)